MTTTAAIEFIRPAIPKAKGIWADIGAGNGIFTQALDQLLLPQSTINALDKNTKALGTLSLQNCFLKIETYDFNDALELPLLDGILMANTLHYSPNPEVVLSRLLKKLRPNGTLIIIEYELNKSRGHWIPYPIPFQELVDFTQQLPLTSPEELGRLPSVYGNNYMYLAKCIKL